MPLINLKVSGNEDPVLAQSLTNEIGRLTKEILNKRPEVTVVIITFIPDYLWFINNVSLASLKTRSFHLDINISDSTNLKTDKSSFIEAVHNALDAILNSVHPVSYTTVHEIRADAYGYDGLTIEYKIISNKINEKATK